MKKITSAVIVLTSLSSFAGSVERFNHKTQKANFLGDMLREFKVHTYDYKSIFSAKDYSLGSVMYAQFKTKDIEDLKNYVVVQYIKGCRYDSKQEEDGSITKTLGYAREFFGDIVKFKHTDFVIDSLDTDPVYSSAPYDRHYSYRWNLKDSFNYKTERYVRDQKPQSPKMYVRDMPGTAIEYTDSAVNTSFKFKTCVFKTKDVPVEVSDPSVDLTGKAIKCFDWSTSFIFNHKLGKFESKDEIDPFCLEK